ncbi:hypothetical protein AVEN_167676-1 [Araneus ventricosus]|uniref:Uncharacterized protein n=1 Tax=Araneus ventricosus TaxID=182803 RepID=A0A4Y2TEB7_ARAVE|nr:hypothetical protein AVEN_167676-1 [Araneus ventricosus]
MDLQDAWVKGFTSTLTKKAEVELNENFETKTEALMKFRLLIKGKLTQYQCYRIIQISPLRYTRSYRTIRISPYATKRYRTPAFHPYATKKKQVIESSRISPLRYTQQKVELNVLCTPYATKREAISSCASPYATKSEEVI